MKKAIPFVLAFTFLAGLFACTRNNATKGGIIRVSPSGTALLISSSQFDTVQNFFAKNAISLAGLQPAIFITAYADILGANGQPYHGNYYLVVCNQFENGLFVYNETLNIYFDSTGALLPNDVYGYSGPQPGTDTAPRMGLSQLRQLFLQTVLTDTSTGARISLLGNRYIDSTLQAALGYLDPGNIPNSGVTVFNKSLRKVWLVSTVNNSKAGGLWIDDSTGQVWH
jgi:hypothetical protein